MRKITSFVLMIILSFGFAFGQSISQNEAENIATDFLKKSSTSSMQRAPLKVNLQLVYQKVDKQQDNNNLFYVYNIKGDNGFVIVSADKRTKKILGYSKTGHFDSKHMPINLVGWLESYAQQIKYAKENLPEVSQADFSKSMSRVAQKTTSVAPLLGTINYNQNAPYNDLCPEKNGKRTVTGCVATAIAQVMKFHNHPNQGKGSHSYEWNGQTLSVDFSTQTYDWTKIKPFYTGNPTTEEKAEVAKLMHHIGVSVDMNYNLATSGGSGAVTSKAVKTLYENFDYDKGIQVYSRDYFTLAEWNDKLKAELDEGHPVIYSGQSSTSGHAFVCDGYDDAGKFHMNWGWGGYSNGYFEITALNPEGLGIGGGNGGYNFEQEMIVGIQKPVAGSEKPAVIGIDGFINVPNQVGRTDYFNLTAKKLKNLGGTEYSGNVYLALIQGDNVIEDLKTKPLSGLPSGSYYGTFSFYSMIPNTVPNGNYQIVVRYDETSTSVKNAFVKSKGVKVIDLEVNDSQILFTTSVPKPTVTMTAKPTVSTNLYQNRKGEFKFKLSNTGDADYNAQLGARLVKKDDNSITQNVFNSIVSIPAGTTEKEFSGIVDITVAQGNYYLEVYYDNNNDASNVNFPTTLLEPNANNKIEVSVLSEPTEAPNLSVNNLSMPAVVTIGEDFNLTATIENTGGCYTDKVLAVIFPSSLGSSVGTFGQHLAFVDNNGTTETTFKGNIANLEAGNYKVAVYQIVNSKYQKISNFYDFELREKSSTGLCNLIEEDGLAVSQTSDVLLVTLPENSEFVRLFNITGKLVYQKNNVSDVVEIPTNSLTGGIFLLQVVDSKQNRFVRKVVVRK